MKSLKKAANSAGASVKSGFHTTAIATNYQMRSASDDFPHKAEDLKAHIASFKAFRSHNSAKAALFALIAHEKNTVLCEKKAHETFAAAAGTAAGAKSDFEAFASAQKALEGHRDAYVATLHKVEEEWKAVEKTEFAEASKQLEKIDHLLNEKLYYKKEKMEEEKKKAKAEYKEHTQKFIEATDKVVALLEGKYKEWTKAVLSAAKTYHQACASSL